MCVCFTYVAVSPYVVASADVIPLSVFQTPSAGEAVVVCGVNITDVTDQDKLHEMVSMSCNLWTAIRHPASRVAVKCYHFRCTKFSSVPTKHTSRLVSSAILSPQSSYLILNDSFYRFCLQAFCFPRRLLPAPPRHGTGDNLRPPAVNRLSPALVPPPPPVRLRSPACGWCGHVPRHQPSPAVTNRLQPSPPAPEVSPPYTW